MDEMGAAGGNGSGGTEDSATGAETLEVALTFSYEPEALTDDLFGVSEETLFEAFELALEAAHIERSVEVSVLITTDEGVRALNRDYRSKDEPTDVLSFPLLDEPLVEAPAEQLWQGAEDGDSDDETESEDGEDGDFDDEDEDGDFDDLSDEGNEDEDEDGDGEDDDEEWPLHLGDIAIAREMVIRQAERAGHSPAYEAALLLVHGVLHLIGYDDQTDAGYRAMVAIQEAVLARAGIAR